MKRTRNGILIPDVPIMAGGNLPNAVKGVSAGGADWKKHAVDMGLPSGTLWADCDIDVNMPDGFCVTPFINQKSFFSWGNVQGYNPIANSFENVYNWGSVNVAEPYYEGQPYGLTKGNTLTDDIPVGAEYDAARAILGASWQMPTEYDYTELMSNVDFLDSDGIITTAKSKATINGVVGFWLQSKINNNRLFFAASGYGNTTNLLGLGVSIRYWTRKYSTDRNAGRNAYALHDNGEAQPTGRCNGCAIRAVVKND